MLSPYGILLITLLALLTYLYLKRNINRKIPPGPTGFPILGNILQLGTHPHLKVKEWVKEYGDIFQMKMGSNRVVVISDPKKIREAYNDPRLSGRMAHEGFQLFSAGSHGILNSEGDAWMEQRRFSMRTLRDLGFGKKSMEGVIMDEVTDFMSFLKSNEGQPLAPDVRLKISTLNVIWGVLSSGNRVKHDDAKFVGIFNRQKEIVEKMTKSLTLFAPSIAKLFPNYSSWNDLIEFRDKANAIFEEHIKEHKENFQEDGSESKDFIDAYLKEIKATSNPQSSFYKERGDRNLIAIMSDFFQAGPDTTSSTLAWAILYLSKFQRVQKKVQAELDQVVGNQRQPTLDDRKNLPYICGTMEEVLRLSSIVPLGVFHRALVDVDFHGFHIPEGTWICHNQYHMQTSGGIWDNPDEFQPERHLSNDEKTLKPKHEANLPFGVGKRACVGESLARDTFFLFLVNIFQKYCVNLSMESKDVTLDAKAGFVLPPQDYKVILSERS